mgnify:CR=1 FL=1
MKQGFRKNRRDGVIFGVCAGIADQFGFDVLWTRVAFVALTLLGGRVGFVYYMVLFAAVAFLAPDQVVWCVVEQWEIDVAQHAFQAGPEHQRQEEASAAARSLPAMPADRPHYSPGG